MHWISNSVQLCSEKTAIECHSIFIDQIWAHDSYGLSKFEADDMDFGAVSAEDIYVAYAELTLGLHGPRAQHIRSCGHPSPCL
jgi:hypothetical protein